LLSNQNFARKIIKNILGIKEILRWRYGPIIFNKNYVHEVYSELQKFLLTQKIKIKGTETPFYNNFNIQWGKSFISETWATFLIDLCKPKDSIWNDMEKHSVRKNIQRSQKRGVEVREMQDSDLPQYFEMLQETKRNVGVEINYDELAILWKTLNSIGMTGFLAFKEKQPISGILITAFNGLINEWGVARTNFDYENKLYSQDFIKWKIIEWGIEKGCKYYDLTGFNPNPKSSKEEGILKYKKKWGGLQKDYWKISG
jgi:lipid II:glycine glycyltransferase (peptidoglycan interpeptide bridge formation enzyme)